MPDPIAFKYRAFISYSHADGRWAKWLHSRLDAFKIDKDLVGCERRWGRGRRPCALSSATETGSQLDTG